MKDESAHQKNDTPAQKGKKPKHFLAQNDVLSLAASICETQEKISLTKAEKHRKSEPDQPKPDHKPNANAKAKLKETKKILSFARVKAKKERSKKRKEQFKKAKASSQGSNPISSTSTTENPDKPARKKVSFA